MKPQHQLSKKKTMEFQINSDALEQPWTGSLEELLEANFELPELVERRIENLRVGERVSFDFESAFEVTRTT